MGTLKSTNINAIRKDKMSNILKTENGFTLRSEERRVGKEC